VSQQFYANTEAVDCRLGGSELYENQACCDEHVVQSVEQVVFVGKVSDGDEIDVAVAHQHKIGHLVPYLEIQ